MKSYWKEIEQMGWGKTSVNYEALSREFHAKWGKRKMQAIRRFVGERVGELYTRVKEWEVNHPRLGIGSDDGFSDVIHHIVGLGEAAFKAAMDNPVLIDRRYNSKYGSKEGYTESFAYCFHTPESYDPKPAKPKTIKVKSGQQMMMLQRFADKFAGESKEALVDRLMEYYSNMPLPDLAAYYKELFPD
jgi:SpoVK/Ycf46/Vps4 family AAA+-type ATPase